MPETEYLVVYETDEDDQEDIELEFNSGRGWAFDDDLEVAIEDVSNTIGTAGLIISGIGAIIGIVTIILFSTNYPQQWYTAVNDPTSTDAMWITAFLGMAAAILLLGGTVLTHVGRRINAQGYRVPHVE